MSLKFKHSGRLGDIVYALPLIKSMAERSGEAAQLFIPSDISSRLGADVYHPGGDRLVSTGLFAFIEPLLEAQPYLRSVHYVQSTAVPADLINLDAFKNSRLNLKGGLIQGWYRKAFGVAFPLDLPWLQLPTAEGAAQPIAWNVLIGRTTRFCNTSINYHCLQDVSRVGFIGLPYEYEDFCARYQLTSVQHVPVENALELAQRMLQSRVYVGNQSVNFAIADGMKICRALEAFEPAPVASPVGGLCTEYIGSSALADFISEVLNTPITASSDLDGDYCDSIKPQEGYRPSWKQRWRERQNKKRKF